MSTGPSSSAAAMRPWRRPRGVPHAATTLFAVARYKLTRRLPQPLHVVVLQHAVMYPGAVMPFSTVNPQTQYVLDRARVFGMPFLVLSEAGRVRSNPMACACDVLGHGKHPDGRAADVVIGLKRVRLERWLNADAPLLAACTDVVETQMEDPDGAVLGLQQLAGRILDHLPDVPDMARRLLMSIQTPGHIADILAANIDATVEEKQDILETLAIAERVGAIRVLLEQQLEILLQKARDDGQDTPAVDPGAGDAK